VTYPDIPVEIRAELSLRRNVAAAVFQAQAWADAARGLEETYHFLLEQQQRYSTRFHKGWELHNQGIALLQLGDISDGITKIYQAYVEDALSADPGSEDAIDESPAGQTLRRFGAPEDVLTAIKSIARDRKARGDIPLIPNAILSDLSLAGTSYERAQASAAEGAKESEPREKRTIEDGLKLPFERRCFVGGHYYGGGPNLEEIRQIVESEGFDPILPVDFEIGEQDVHHRSLLLLHLSSRAIFEVTFPAGQLMELERCRDYNIEPLLVRNTLRDQDPHVSAMISSMSGYDVRPTTFQTTGGAPGQPTPGGPASCRMSDYPRALRSTSRSHRDRTPRYSRRHSTPRQARILGSRGGSTPPRQGRVIAAERLWAIERATCQRCCRSPVLCRSSCMRRRRAGCRAPRQPPATARRSRAGGQPSGCE